MNDLAAEILKTMVGRYGVTLAQDPVRCEGLLRDSCSKCSREIFVLVHAIRQKIPSDLLEPRHALPLPLLRGFLAKRLQDELGFSDEASRWAVAAWADALGIEGGKNSLKADSATRSSQSTGAGSAAMLPGTACDPVLRERWADGVETGTVAARLDAIRGLAHSPDPGCTRILIGALDNTCREVRIAAYDAIASQGMDSAALLIEALGDTSDGIVWRSTLLLAGLPAKQAAGPLIALLDREGRVRSSAIWALGEIQSPEAVTPLMKFVNSPDKVVREEAVGALKKIGGG